MRTQQAATSGDTSSFIDAPYCHHAILNLQVKLESDPERTIPWLLKASEDNPLFDYIRQQGLKEGEEGKLVFNPDPDCKILFDVAGGKTLSGYNVWLLRSIVLQGAGRNKYFKSGYKEFNSQERMFFSLALAKYNLKNLGSAENPNSATIGDIQLIFNQAFQRLTEYASEVRAAANVTQAQVRLSKLAHYFLRDYFSFAIHVTKEGKNWVIWAAFIKTVQQIEGWLKPQSIAESLQKTIIDQLNQYVLPLIDEESDDAKLIRHYLRQFESTDSSVPVSELFEQAKAHFEKQQYHSAVKTCVQGFKAGLKRESVGIDVVGNCFLGAVQYAVYKKTRSESLALLNDKELLGQFSQRLKNADWKKKQDFFRSFFAMLDGMNRDSVYVKAKSFLKTLIRDIDDDDLCIDDASQFLEWLSTDPEFGNHFREDVVFFNLINLFAIQWKAVNGDRTEASKQIHNELGFRQADLACSGVRYASLSSQLIEGLIEERSSYYRLYSLACYRTAKLIQAKHIEPLTTSSLTVRAQEYLLRAAVFGSVRACIELSELYEKEGSYGRAILWKLASCSNKSEAQRFLESVQELPSKGWFNKRKNFAAYLLDRLNYGYSLYGISVIPEFYELGPTFREATQFGYWLDEQCEGTHTRLKKDLAQVQLEDLQFIKQQARRSLEKQQEERRQHPLYSSLSARSPLSLFSTAGAPLLSQLEGEQEGVSASTETPLQGEETERQPNNPLFSSSSAELPVSLFSTASAPPLPQPQEEPEAEGASSEIQLQREKEEGSEQKFDFESEQPGLEQEPSRTVAHSATLFHRQQGFNYVGSGESASRVKRQNAHEKLEAAFGSVPSLNNPQKHSDDESEEEKNTGQQKQSRPRGLVTEFS